MLCKCVNRNQLRSLPLEFSDLLETIPEVRLEDNPWTDYPNQWGLMFMGKRTADSKTGYDVPKVLEFLYAMKLFYNEAEVIWSKRGTFYYTQRLNFKDFIEDLRQSMDLVKYKQLSIEHVKVLFFLAREKGLFPKWYALDDRTVHDNMVREKEDAIRRESNMKRSLQDDLERIESMHQAYDVDVKRKANRAKELMDEYLINEAIMTQTSSIMLKELLIRREHDSDKRKLQVDLETFHKEMNEIRRLEGILEDELKIRKKYHFSFDDE